MMLGYRQNPSIPQSTIEFRVIETLMYDASKEDLFPYMGEISCFKCAGMDGARVHVCGKDGPDPFGATCKKCGTVRCAIPVSTCGGGPQWAPHTCVDSAVKEDKS